MPASAVGDEVRSKVRDLGSEVGSDTAEDVALAMVQGAAQGYLDLVAVRSGDRRAARRRLILAVPVTRDELFEGVAHLRDS